ncbi:MAG TPA: L-threonylcarbamoyladenylate synthase [Bacteroidales bacterium]|nr:L-threonylcarbamoyladenylate synthase [Bacteroidales bacterium]
MNHYQEEIEKAASALRKGLVILYPTDTIWGLGCDATNRRAINRLLRIKRRTDSKSLITLIDDVVNLTKYVKEVPAVAYDLLQNSANPLSIIFPAGQNLARNAYGPDGSVCIRVTNSSFCKSLVQAFGRPIASTSANFAGESTPLYFGQISKELIKSTDHVVNLYQDVISTPKASTIIRIEKNGSFTIVRP